MPGGASWIVVVEVVPVEVTAVVPASPVELDFDEVASILYPFQAMQRWAGQDNRGIQVAPALHKRRCRIRCRRVGIGLQDAESCGPAVHRVFARAPRERRAGHVFEVKRAEPRVGTTADIVADDQGNAELRYHRGSTRAQRACGRAEHCQPVTARHAIVIRPWFLHHLEDRAAHGAGDVVVHLEYGINVQTPR